MPSSEYNFTIEQGTKVVISFLYVDGNGQAVDLTDYKIHMQARQSYASEDVLLSASTEDNKFTIDPLLGKITLTLSDEETSSYSWRKAIYDVELVPPGGGVIRFIHGAITVLPEVTRWPQ